MIKNLLAGGVFVAVICSSIAVGFLVLIVMLDVLGIVVPNREVIVSRAAINGCVWALVALTISGVYPHIGNRRGS